MCTLIRELTKVLYLTLNYFLYFLPPISLKLLHCSLLYVVKRGVSVVRVVADLTDRHIRPKNIVVYLKRSMSSF